MSVHTVNASGGVEVQRPEFLGSALNGGQPPASRHSQPTLKDTTPSINWTESRVGPRAESGSLEETTSSSIYASNNIDHNMLWSSFITSNPFEASQRDSILGKGTGSLPHKAETGIIAY
jgi:hypothetical protein